MDTIMDIHNSIMDIQNHQLWLSIIQLWLNHEYTYLLIDIYKSTVNYFNRQI